jgi:hypothetical protein
MFFNIIFVDYLECYTGVFNLNNYLSDILSAIGVLYKKHVA